MPDLRTRRTAAVGGVLLALRFVASAALNYGFGIALVWVLPKADFGVVGVLQNVLLLAAMMLGGSFTWVVSRVIARTGTIEGDAAAVFRAALAGNLAVGAVFVAVLVASHALPSSGSRGLLAPVIITVALMAVNGILYAALQGTQRFDAIAAQQTLEVAVKVAVGLGLVVGLGFGVSGVALGFLAGTLAAGLLCLRGLRDLLPGRGPVELRRTAALALPTGVGAAGFGLLLTLDVIALGAVGPVSGVTTATIGTYQAAAILARTPYYLAEAVGTAAYPDIARGSGATAAHVAFVAAFRWIPLVLVPLQMVLLVAPEPILRMFFPQDYANAAGLVRLLTLGTLGLMVTSLLFTALYATGFEVTVARRLPVAAALELGVLVALVPRVGAVGAGIAFAVGSWAAAALLALAYLGHHRVRPLERGLVARYLAAVAVLVAGLVVARGLPSPVDLLILPLPLGVYAAAAVRLGMIRESDLVRARAVRGALRRGAAPLVGLARRVRRAAASSAQDALTAACAAFVAAMLLWNLSTSPDTQYDEVVYATAAWRVAQTGDLTWTGQPLFVHPPLSFLAQSAWLSMVGRSAADLPAVIGMARLLAGLVAIANIGLLALLTSRLTPMAGGRRRSVLVLAVVALAATDPILLRYSRLAIIEPFAIFACLVALNLSWALRDRRARIAVPALGLATGLALLTNEIGIFLLVTPLVHALLSRAWPQIRRAAAVLVVGGVVWLVFPLWALQLGLFPSFVSVKASTLRRLLGVEQDSGWNQAGASFVSAVVEHAGQYATSYLVLAGGARRVALAGLPPTHRHGPVAAGLAAHQLRVRRLHGRARHLERAVLHLRAPGCGRRDRARGRCGRRRRNGARRGPQPGARPVPRRVRGGRRGARRRARDHQLGAQLRPAQRWSGPGNHAAPGHDTPLLGGERLGGPGEVRVPPAGVHDHRLRDGSGGAQPWRAAVLRQRQGRRAALRLQQSGAGRLDPREGRAAGGVPERDLPRGRAVVRPPRGGEPALRRRADPRWGVRAARRVALRRVPGGRRSRWELRLGLGRLRGQGPVRAAAHGELDRRRRPPGVRGRCPRDDGGPA